MDQLLRFSLRDQPVVVWVLGPTKVLGEQTVFLGGYLIIICALSLCHNRWKVVIYVFVFKTLLPNLYSNH